RLPVLITESGKGSGAAGFRSRSDMMKNITFSASFFRELFWFVVMTGSWFVVWYMTGLLQHYY
ncbi:hypothetical protein ACX5IX_004632, partial [Salmonella enterica subsp. enterica serovar Enteritidis]